LTSIDKDRAARVFDLVSNLDRKSRPSIFEWVLTRRTRFVETRTSDMLVNLLGELAFDGTAAVFDPAAGEGGFLIAAAQAMGRRASLSGQEINRAASGLAGSVSSFTTSRRMLCDSLAEDAESSCGHRCRDPPYGAKPVQNVSPGDPRWLLASARRRTYCGSNT
jgi:hypothetical protein